MAKNKISAADLESAIATKYAAPKWATFFNVPDAVGMSANRRADAVAMGLWQSAGRHLHGFEIKVTRGDWMRELQDPLKAHAISRFCHFWWIVAPKGVVKTEEMPASWGLQEFNGNGLRVKKGIEPREAETPTWEFIAGILRKAQEASPSTKELKGEFNRGYEHGKSFYKNVESQKLVEKRVQRRLGELEKSVADFEEVSGIKINTYNGRNIGKIVQLVQGTGVWHLQLRMQNLSTQLSQISEIMGAASQSLKENLEGPNAD